MQANFPMLAVSTVLMLGGLLAFFIAGASGREYYYNALDSNFCAELFARSSEAVSCGQSLVQNLKTNLMVSIGLFFASGALIASSVFTAFLSTRKP